MQLQEPSGSPAVTASSGGAGGDSGTCLGTSSRVTLRCLSPSLLHSVPLVYQRVHEVQELNLLDRLLMERTSSHVILAWGVCSEGAGVFLGVLGVLA